MNDLKFKNNQIIKIVALCTMFQLFCIFDDMAFHKNIWKKTLAKVDGRLRKSRKYNNLDDSENVSIKKSLPKRDMLDERKTLWKSNVQKTKTKNLFWWFASSHLQKKSFTFKKVLKMKQQLLNAAFQCPCHELSAKTTSALKEGFK